MVIDAIRVMSQENMDPVLRRCAILSTDAIWLLLGMFFVLAVPGTSAALSAKSADENALRELVNDFFTTLQLPNTQGQVSRVSPRSPNFPEIRQMIEQGKSSHEQTAVHVRQVGPVEINGTEATVQVSLEITPKTRDSSAEHATSWYAERLVHCVQEQGTWKIWRIGPTALELAIMLAAKPTEKGREELLAGEAELATPVLTRTLMALGDRSFQQGNYGAAQATYLLAGEIAAHISDQSGEAASQRSVGNTLFYARLHNQALATYQSAMKLAEEIDDKAELARCLNAIGNVYAAQSDGRAIDFYRKSLELLVKLGDTAEAARVLNNIGNSSFAQTQYPAALRSYRRSLQLKLRARDDAGISIALYNIANVFYARGQYREARKKYQASLRRAEKTGRKAGLASIHRGMGDVSYSLWDDARAMQDYTLSLQVERQIGDVAGIREDLLKLALVYSSRGDYGKALQLDQEALTMQEKSDDPNLKARILDRTGLVLLALGKNTEAIEKFQTTKAIHDTLSDSLGSLRSLQFLGWAHLSAGEYTVALKLFESALAKAQATGDREQAVVLQVHIAGAYLKSGEYAKAAVEAERAVHEAHAAGLWEMEWQAGAVAARAFLEQGSLSRVRRFSETAMTIYEQMAKPPRDGEPGLESEVEDIPDPFATALRLALKQGQAARAWFICERAKSAALRHSLQTGSTEITKSMTMREVELEEHLAEAVQMFHAEVRRELRSERGSGGFRNLLASFHQAKARYAAFETNLLQQRPGLRASRGYPPLIAGSQARTIVLPANTALLEFYVDEDSMHVFVLRRCASSMPRQPCPAMSDYSVKITRSALSSLIERYLAALANPQGDYASLGRELYDLLLEPAETMLVGVRTLYLVPDSVLWKLPFSALQDGEGNFLVQSRSLAYFSSFADVQRTRASSRLSSYGEGNAPQVGTGGPHASLVMAKGMGAAIKKPSLFVLSGSSAPSQNLTGTEWTPSDSGIAKSYDSGQEVDSITKLYPGRSAVLFGKRASTEAFKKNAFRFDTVHIASLSRLNDHDPQHSAIFFPGAPDADGPAEIHELMKLNLRARTAILANAELVWSTSGELGQSLAVAHWAWMDAGCPELVLSEWRTDKDSAHAFLVELHRSLQTGQPRNNTAAEALRSAQLKLMGKKSYHHPYYWSGFRAMGSN
jgi:CHAT domain-containing protein/tetratricopeptide (TPR) repeat protein